MAFTNPLMVIMAGTNMFFTNPLMVIIARTSMAFTNPLVVIMAEANMVFTNPLTLIVIRTTNMAISNPFYRYSGLHKYGLPTTNSTWFTPTFCLLFYKSNISTKHIITHYLGIIIVLYRIILQEYGLVMFLIKSSTLITFFANIASPIVLGIVPLTLSRERLISICL